ncbi:RNA polymerase sigma factor [Micromonospora sp. KC721]|uniref:RNA polymerase sigma factor n=1 Tax=Micromonospora sp. KC721 TaxID=2530380 RepID=UPI00104C05C2|nr:sigma-70 family RNA polymerase sigma factor [Micromonospora sp. KC721]TDB82522.1 sigma-70 family RNA polymerase sigma factor [Micromonospora sp. KC721]
MAQAAGADETSLVTAAQAGDGRALDELFTAYLPVVYTIVRRAIDSRPDVDDVVQDTMLRVLRALRTLRTPDSFEPWLMAITMRQVSTYLRRRQATAGRTTDLGEVIDAADADTEGLTMLRLELSDQRRQVVRASRWLDRDDRLLLSLWWLEAAGQLTRTELAAELGTSVAHAGVRVQRMRNRLELSRSLVAALEASPICAGLTAVLEGWDGAPGPLWRKRVVRHTRSCQRCLRAADRLLAPESLLVDLALPPASMSRRRGARQGQARRKSDGDRPGGGPGHRARVGVAQVGVKAELLGRLAQVIGACPSQRRSGTVLVGAPVTATTGYSAALRRIETRPEPLPGTGTCGV